MAVYVDAVFLDIFVIVILTDGVEAVFNGIRIADEIDRFMDLFYCNTNIRWSVLFFFP